MSRDVYVHLYATVPDAEVEKAVKSFFGEAASCVFTRGALIASLAGKPESFKGTLDVNDSRWIEVVNYRGASAVAARVTVTTRLADAYTNGCALALAKRLAQIFGGRVEEAA